MRQACAMDPRQLPAAKSIAIALVVLLFGFYTATYYYVVTNGTSLTSLAILDGAIGAGVIPLAAGLWTGTGKPRELKLIFVACVVFFVLSYLAFGFGAPYTDSVAILLLFAGLVTIIMGLFIRKAG